MRPPWTKILCSAAVFVLFTWVLTVAPPLSKEAKDVKNSETPIQTAGKLVPADSALERRIKDAALTLDEAPINARIDPVWKLIPGYNGLVVDEKKTLRLAREQGAGHALGLVFKEVRPDVQLHDLPANPIYRGNERKPMAAFMVNVAWGTEHLQPMLDVLAREQVAATFFLDGSWLEKHPEEARRIAERGHEIGNHAYHHPQMSRLTREKMRHEIAATEQLIEETLGRSSTYFAPPSGDFDENVVRVASDLGLFTVLWTADTVDWHPSSSPHRMVQRVQNHIGNGALVLMHPTARTVEALPEMIRAAEEKGLKLGTVSDVLSSERMPRIELGPIF